MYDGKGKGKGKSKDKGKEKDRDSEKLSTTESSVEEKKKDDIKKIKVCIYGEEGSGKTTLINRFIGNDSSSSSSSSSTAQVKSKKTGKSYNVTIKDLYIPLVDETVRFYIREQRLLQDSPSLLEKQSRHLSYVVEDCNYLVLTLDLSNPSLEKIKRLQEVIDTNNSISHSQVFLNCVVATKSDLDNTTIERKSSGNIFKMFKPSKDRDKQNKDEMNQEKEQKKLTKAIKKLLGDSGVILCAFADPKDTTNEKAEKDKLITKLFETFGSDFIRNLRLRKTIAKANV